MGSVFLGWMVTWTDDKQSLKKLMNRSYSFIILLKIIIILSFFEFTVIEESLTVTLMIILFIRMKEVT